MPIKHSIDDIFKQLEQDLITIIKDVKPYTVEIKQLPHYEREYITHSMTTTEIQTYIDEADNEMTDYDINQYSTKAIRLLEKFYTGEHINDFYLTYVDRLSSHFHDWVGKHYDLSYFEDDGYQNNSLSENEIETANNDTDVALLNLEVNIYALFWEAMERLTLDEIINMLEQKYALNDVKNH